MEVQAIGIEPPLELQSTTTGSTQKRKLSSWTLHWGWYQCRAVNVCSGGEERSEPARPDEQNGGQLSTQGSNIILRL
jgi:hypothetical protein